MLAAGFHVARGCSTGDKTETTIALTPRAIRNYHELLAVEWLDKWKRSSARFPTDLPAVEHSALTEAILQHPQFQLL